ncbi:hypothetical protein [Hyphomonas jannaschiana]|nr:hypothetical protein [Hyphomonas jannaschiana]
MAAETASSYSRMTDEYFRSAERMTWVLSAILGVLAIGGVISFFYSRALVVVAGIGIVAVAGAVAISAINGLTDTVFLCAIFSFIAAVSIWLWRGVMRRMRKLAINPAEEF